MLFQYGRTVICHPFARLVCNYMEIINTTSLLESPLNVSILETAESDQNMKLQTDATSSFTKGPVSSKGAKSTHAPRPRRTQQPSPGRMHKKKSFPAALEWGSWASPAAVLRPTAHTGPLPGAPWGWKACSGPPDKLQPEPAAGQAHEHRRSSPASP